MKYCCETSVLSSSCLILLELKGDLLGCCDRSNTSNFLLQGLRFHCCCARENKKISMYVLVYIFKISNDVLRA